MLISTTDMELTTQIIYFWFLVLASGGYPDDLRPPDILDPLKAIQHGLFGPSSLRHHHNHHGFQNPGMLDHFKRPNDTLSTENSNEGNLKENMQQNENKRNVTSERLPINVNLQSHYNNKTVQDKDIKEKVETRVREILNTNSDYLEQLKLISNGNILRTNKNKTVATDLSKSEILSENKSVAIFPNELIVLKFKDKAKVVEKSNIPQENKYTGGSIVFPDSVYEAKLVFKDTNKELNTTNKLNVTDYGKVNYTKNSENILFPVQVVQVVPTQLPIIQNGNAIENTNTNSLLTPVQLSQNLQNPANQPVPITNDVFPNRPPVYTTNTVQRPLYTNVVNSFAQNGVQPDNFALNSNYYQNPSQVLSANVQYNTPYNNQNVYNLNHNVGPSNNIESNPPMNLVNSQYRQTSVPLNAMLVNPTGYGSINQPNYNVQQQSLYPAANMQNNNMHQQGPTVPTGVIPFSYNNIQGSQPLPTQSIGYQNTAPNYSGNVAQPFVPQNTGQTYMPNNVQPLSAQNYYIMPNTNQLSNNINNNGQPVVLNPQGNMLSSNLNALLPDNNQKYMVVNTNQQNVPQNGPGSSIPALQNGQIVALVPHQMSSGAFVNNNANGQILPVVNNNNVQPNTIRSNSNTVIPQPIFMNTGTMPNNPVILNGQSPTNSGFNGQNSLVSGNPALYTVVNIPNVNSNYQIPSSSVNLVGMKDKVEQSGTANAAT